MTTIPATTTPPTVPVVQQPSRTQLLLKRLRPSRMVVNIVLGAIALFWLVPTLSMMIISFRPSGLFEVSGWWKVFSAPSQLTLQNYKELFTGGSSTALGGGVPSGLAPGSVLDALRTSLEISIPATILVTAISSLAAYSIVFGRWRGRNAVFLTIVGLMVVPLQVALIPVAALYKDMGSAFGWNPFGTITGVVIFHVAFGLPFGVFLMRNFFTGLPTALIEAGRIDGAGEWTLFRRVVIPLGVAAAASLAIFQFIWVWNDLLVALVFLGGRPARAAHLVPVRPGENAGGQLLDHLDWVDGLNRRSPHRLLGFPTPFRPWHARRGGEMRYLAEPSRSPCRQRLPGDMPDMMIAILNDMGFGDLNFHGGLGDARGRPPLGETPSPSSSPGWSTHIRRPRPSVCSCTLERVGSPT